MEEKNYVTFDLPPYFTFQELLNKTARKIGSSNITDFLRVEEATNGMPRRAQDPKYVDGVNYKLLASKDGEFAWRPFEIIHPALYVALVNHITDTSIIDRKELDEIPVTVPPTEISLYSFVS